MNEEQEKALIASIEHKIGNVLQSVRSRGGSMHSQDTAQKQSSQGSADLFSSITPGHGASSGSSGITTLPGDPRGASGEEKPFDMEVSADDFEENFSDGPTSERLDTDLPVDSLANFITPAEMNRKGSVRKKERGHITDMGATEENEESMIRRKSRGKQNGRETEALDRPAKNPNLAGRFMRKLTHGLRSNPKNIKHGTAGNN